MVQSMVSVVVTSLIVWVSTPYIGALDPLGLALASPCGGEGLGLEGPRLNLIIVFRSFCNKEEALLSNIAISPNIDTPWYGTPENGMGWRK